MTMREKIGLVDRLRAMASTHRGTKAQPLTAICDEAADLIVRLSTLTDEMVERGAKAGYMVEPARASFTGDPIPWEELGEYRRFMCIEKSRACLTEAIRAAKGE